MWSEIHFMKKHSFHRHDSFPIFNTDEVDFRLELDGDYFRLLEYHPQCSVLPDYFRIDYYAVVIFLKGEMNCSINLHNIHVRTPSVITLLPDFVLHVDSVSEDCKALILAHNERFADDLQMNDYSYRAKHAARTYPCNDLSEGQLQTSLQYFYLLHEVLRQQENPNVRDCTVKLTCSFFHYLQGCFNKLYKRQSLLSRAEQLTTDFFGLMEENCFQHKHLAWYAEQLCITPKYLANVIKKMTGKPAGAWFDEYILLQAKTLLTSSRLTIQQVSDRLGFKNQSHFGTFFRRATGLNPTLFRKHKLANG